MLDRLEQAVEAVSTTMATVGVREALRPFFDEQPCEVDLDQQIEELWAWVDLVENERHLKVRATKAKALKSKIKALAAELQPAGVSEERFDRLHAQLTDTQADYGELEHKYNELLSKGAAGVSDETIEAIVNEWYPDPGDSRSELRASLSSLLRDHLQPKPLVWWPDRDPYPEDWQSVEEFVPTEGDRVLMADNPPLSAPPVWSGIWPDPNASHWCRLKAGPSA